MTMVLLVHFGSPYKKHLRFAKSWLDVSAKKYVVPGALVKQLGFRALIYVFAVVTVNEVVLTVRLVSISS